MMKTLGGFALNSLDKIIVTILSLDSLVVYDNLKQSLSS